MNKNYIIGGISIATGLGLSIVTAVLGKKVKELTVELNNLKKQVVDDISGKINVDVPNEYIERAVDKAVDREAKDRIKYLTMEVSTDIKKDIHKQVSTAIEDSYKDVKGEVKRELLNQVGDVSVERIKREVIDEAKEKAAKQFDQDLEEVLEKHNKELDKVTEIYSSIAKSMRGDK